MSVQVDPSPSSEVQRPDLSAYRRPTHYAASPELKALYAGDCQSCGMCCLFYFAGPFRCPIMPEPFQQPPKRFIQIGKRAKQWTREQAIKIQRGEYGQVGVETSGYLRTKSDGIWKGHNRCAALTGVQGVKVECSIYNTRPYACSDYEPGSPDCLKVRQWGNLHPLDDGYGHS